LWPRFQGRIQADSQQDIETNPTGINNHPSQIELFWRDILFLREILARKLLTFGLGIKGGHFFFKLDIGVYQSGRDFLFHPLPSHRMYTGYQQAEQGRFQPIRAAIICPWPMYAQIPRIHYTPLQAVTDW
jgi:hypothetical protein